MIRETAFEQFDGFASLWVYKSNLLQGVALISRKNTGDDTALTDAAALNGLSSQPDGQSMHFPQDSGMWPLSHHIWMSVFINIGLNTNFFQNFDYQLGVPCRCIFIIATRLWMLMDSEHCAGSHAVIWIFMILFLIVIHKRPVSRTCRLHLPLCNKSAADSTRSKERS